MQDPVAADYGHSWYAATAVEAPERAPLAHDIDVDVCVIGGGLAGLTAAREVARLGWSVALLEAKRIAWNASGRNCGFVLPGFAADVRRVIERVGLDQARRLWTISEAGVHYVRTAIQETGMPGVALQRGWLDVSKVDDGDDMVALLGLLGQQFGATVEGWPVERVREALRSDGYFHAIHFPNAFHIHPLNYALGLARAAEDAGARIYERTPALEIDPAGVRKRVLAKSALVRAGHVVLAGNTHIGGLMPRLAGTVLPVTGHVMVTAPLDARLDEAIAYRGAVSDSRFANHHYRIVDGNRLMWSGGGGAFARGPRRAAEGFKSAIKATYPQLGDVDIAYAWSGEMGFPVHRMPQVGEASPGLWVASGFGGHGLNTSAIAGVLVARAIADNDDNWRAFSAYDLAWAGGALGRAFAEGMFFVCNAREAFAAKRARRRDRQRRARPEAADAAPPHWGEARAATDQAVADAKTDEAYDPRAGAGEPLRRRAAGAAEDGGAGPDPAPPKDVDWRRAKQAFGPDGR